MKRKTAVLVVLGLVIISAGTIFVLQRDDGHNKSVDNTPSQMIGDDGDDNDRQVPEEKTGAPVAAGKYVDYSPTVIAETPGTKVLFFHAPWCPQCRALEKSIEEGQIPENTTIIKVDYDTNQRLRQEYGVTIQTTLVRVDDQAKLVKKYVAYDDPSLETLIRNLL